MRYILTLQDPNQVLILSTRNSQVKIAIIKTFAKGYGHHIVLIVKLYFRVIPLAALIGRWVNNLQTNQSEHCEFLFRIRGGCVRQGAGSIS